MKQVVYVDVLIASNFVINYLLLFVTAKISGRNLEKKGRTKRLLFGALIGSLFSLTIFLPELSTWAGFAVKILTSGTMMFISNPFTHLGQYLKEWLILFVVTALFGGIMLAIWISFVPSFMLCANGVVYFHLSPLLLIVNVSAAYVIVSLVDRLLKSSHVEEGTYAITLWLEGKSKKMLGLVDTGNNLTEPFSGLPVVVCGITDIADILPKDFVVYLEKEHLKSTVTVVADMAGQENSEEKEESEENKKSYPMIRMIPYSGVDSFGLLPAIRGELLTIGIGRRQATVEAFYVAISKKNIGNGYYQVLLSQGLMKTNTGGG